MNERTLIRAPARTGDRFPPGRCPARSTPPWAWRNEEYRRPRAGVWETLTGPRRNQFFLDWYDGLMRYSGTDRVDHWMPAVTWTPDSNSIRVNLDKLTKDEALALFQQAHAILADAADELGIPFRLGRITA